MKVLVANRGEIACRILCCLREMGLQSVAVFTDLDRDAPHVWLADEAVHVGPAEAYLNGGALLEAAAGVGATALHPGYGFLSQSPGFARACAAAGVTFIGPSPEAMEALGDKRAARQVAERCQIPVVPGATACDSVADAQKAAARVGFPVLLKAAGGGGGKGMRQVRNPEEMAESFAAAQRESRGAFGDERLLVEKYIDPARHVEVQVMGDGKTSVALHERECSLQRRYQKIIEEAPASSLTAAVRARLHNAAVRLTQEVGYANAGTVEFLLADDGSFYFLEVNTRLQVEHPVTEMILHLDLVHIQLQIAQGSSLQEVLPAVPDPCGHAIEARLNAEDAYSGFLPAVGRVLHLDFPHIPGVRVDCGIATGSEITPHYDPLLAKVISWGPNREQARLRLLEALRRTSLLGVQTNQSFLIDLLRRDFFVNGQTFTNTVEKTPWQAAAVPPYVQAAAQQAAVPGRGTVPQNASLQGDPYSPWTALGGLRAP